MFGSYSERSWWSLIGRITDMNPTSAIALGKFFLLQNRTPTYLLMFVTNRCEAKCSHCFYWKARNSGIRELSLDEIEAFARRLGPMIQVTLTGGSPELRQDLAEIGSIFWRHCVPMNITLCSNGNHPDKLFEDVAEIYRRHPDCRLTVDISLDGLHEEHDRLRGIDGLFDNVVRSYRRLEMLRRDHQNLRLGCGLCVSGLNKHSALHTARWAMENLPLDNFTPVLVRGEPQEPAASDTDPEVFLAIAGEVEKRLRSRSYRGYASFSNIVNRKDIIQKRLIHDIYTSHGSPIRCGAARETAVVYPDGTVAGCELRDEILGSLPEHGMNIAGIWRGGETRKFRKQIRDAKCWCWHQCFLSPTIMKSPRLWM